MVFHLVSCTVDGYYCCDYTPYRCLFSSKCQHNTQILINTFSKSFFIVFQVCVYNNQVPRWINFYSLFIVVVLPSIVTIVFNSMIFFFVRSSTRRVHATATAPTTSVANTNLQHARDMYLVKHMVFIFIVFLIGWTPIYIESSIVFSRGTLSWLFLLLQMLPVFSSLINILDLFMYNHDLRKYLKEQIIKWLRLNRN